MVDDSSGGGNGDGSNRSRIRRLERGQALTNAHLERMDGRLERVEVRLEQMDARLGQMDTRLEQMDARLGQMDARLEETNGHLRSVIGTLAGALEVLVDMRTVQTRTAEILARLATSVATRFETTDGELASIRARVTRLERHVFPGGPPTEP